MKKRTLQLITLIILSGCNSIPMNNIAPGYLQTFESIKNALIGYENNTITRQLVDNIPYASMTLKIGKGPKGLMILESAMNEEYTWISADSLYLIIKNGRIIKTEGLDNDLKRIIFPSLDFKKILDGSVKKFKAYYSYENPELNNLELEFSYKVKEREIINILDKKIELLLINEKITNDYYGWRFTNQYWIDEDFFIWKSIQTISPKIPEFNIEITKKPSL